MRFWKLTVHTYILYIYIYIYPYIHISIYPYIYSSISLSLYISLYTYIYIYIYIYKFHTHVPCGTQRRLRRCRRRRYILYNILWYDTVITMIYYTILYDTMLCCKYSAVSCGAQVGHGHRSASGRAGKYITPPAAQPPSLRLPGTLPTALFAVRSSRAARPHIMQLIY